ncbi:MAG TPA: CehA/McbA family metallohydrolase [Candidatus Limnocylindrales bacterium]
MVSPLLDTSGRWTHRDRHRHVRFEIEVPEHTTELRIGFRWEPADLGSEHEANGLSLTLFDPQGFRGAGSREQEIVVGESEATLGYLAGRLPPGTWVLSISTASILNDGSETGYLVYHLAASATIAGASTGDRPAALGPAAAARRSSLPGGPGWYRGDLHSHTVHSDGEITVEDRVRGAVDRGLDFLAITDHNTISHHREIDRWPEVITPIRASEVTTFHGHLNCFGLHQAIDWRTASRGGGAVTIADQAHRQNALISINHPAAFGDPWCVGCHWDFALVDYSTIDAIEVWNGRWAIPETANDSAVDLWTDLLDAGLRPTAISGTDSHSAEEDEYVALPMNHVHADDRSEAAILEGIRRGHVFLSSGPIVSFRARGSDGVEVGLPGSELPGDGRVDLEVDVDGLEGPATLWFVTSGSRSALGACERGSARLLRPGLAASKWWRLELRSGSASNGDLLALTNPVWVGGRAGQ